MKKTRKHLTLDERIAIEEGLVKKHSFQMIADSIHKSPSTISKEIRRNSQWKASGAYGRPHNPCIKRQHCDIRLLCSDPACKKSFCRLCSRCHQLCSEFVEEECPLPQKAPYACNGCNKKMRCVLKKKIYSARDAQKAADLRLSDSRSGLAISPDEIQELDAFLSPLLKNNLSLHHICANNPDKIMWSQKSLYKYINAGCFSARNIDLPKQVRYRKRTNKSVIKKVDRKCRVNRTYKDFLTFLNQNPDTSVVEMDTVEGRKGGKVFLTLFFRNSQLMLVFLRDHNTSQSVIDIINRLFNELGAEIFHQLFPVILTDNGSEFSNPLAIEFDQNNQRRTNLFYCDPGHPEQKGGIEKNHVEVRLIVPKGTSFDSLTDEDALLITNHINAKSRKKLNSRCPSELFSLIYGDNIFKKLHLSLIKPNDVCLTPRLLKDR